MVIAAAIMTRLGPYRHAVMKTSEEPELVLNPSREPRIIFRVVIRPTDGLDSKIGIGEVVAHLPLPHHSDMRGRIRRFSGLRLDHQTGEEVQAMRSKHWVR